jgi:hypothetical protein
MIDRPYKCENPDCGREFTKDELKAVNAKMGWNIPDVSERVAPGEVFPIAQCPFCGHLVHEKPENAVAPEPKPYPDHTPEDVITEINALVKSKGSEVIISKRVQELVPLLLIVELRKLNTHLEDIEGAIRDGGS